ncbi:MAG: hypothetical protein ACPGOV_05675 [Magnetovibrionaceae bacterium]
MAPTDILDQDDNRRRYFDKAMSKTVVQVVQGDFYVTNQPGEVLTTILGSCISACVRDPKIGYGGMNHFLLPSPGDLGSAVNTSLRYGSFAMEQLINAILSRGGRRENLEIKVFGGGNVIRAASGVGHKNADFIEEYLANEGFMIASQHLRGNSARKVLFFPRSGRVRMRELPSTHADKIHSQEISRAVKVKKTTTPGTVELFD